MNLASILSVLLLLQSPSVTGTWTWKGSAGWQRLTLSLRGEGRTLRGTVRMGAGSPAPQPPAEDWEYFFDSVDFGIDRGTIEGDRVAFEHDVYIDGVKAKFVYTGVVAGNRLRLTRETVRPGAAPSAPERRVEFTVERAP